MRIFPAIDIIDGEAVRLVKGDYSKKTVYGSDPSEVAVGFARKGAEYLHVVDLDGARDGSTANLEVIKSVIEKSGLKTEVGGGIRSMGTIERYLDIGVMRVIIGTAAVTAPELVEKAVKLYDDRIAVGIDIKDGMVAIKGWTEKTQLDCFSFFERMENCGVKTVICTDISRDGVLAGTNIALYEELSKRFSIDIVASGGVTSIDDINKLKGLGLYGAILGKAIYAGAIKLEDAIEAARGGEKR